MSKAKPTSRENALHLLHRMEEAYEEWRKSEAGTTIAASAFLRYQNRRENVIITLQRGLDDG
jgi:hypothetical protein